MSQTTGHPVDEHPGETEQVRPLAQLAAELGTLAAEIAAHTCRFLQVLGEFDAQEGWRQYVGMCSCAHWLSWRCGMSGSTAREHVRVARALRDLPVTQAEFAAGRLSYSKVRAITRVGTAVNEDELVQVARAASAVQLDRLCAGIRNGASLDDVNARHRRRRLSYRVEEDGSVCFSVRSSPEDGAEILEALRRAQDYLERTAASSDAAAHLDPVQAVEEEVARPGHSLLDALVLICAQSDVAAAPEEAEAEEQVQSPGTNGDVEPVRASRRSETVLHTTLTALAAAAGGDTHLELGPALHAETARRLCCDTGVVMHLHEDAPAGAAAEGMVSMSSPRPGRTIDVGRRSRRPNAALFRALWHRDQGCVFPGCGRRRFLHAHHLRHWVRGGPTTLANMALLCGEHHRAHHEGGFDLRRGPDGTLCTYAPDGQMVRTVPAAVSAGRTQDSCTGDLTAMDGRPFNLGYAVSTLLVNRQLREERQTTEPRAA
ncbi:HNH endonuclease signature motif containing protein [Ruania albidiflava]|uniref:HNH endonuclease signature motif containing protein n=1 Tax=Ruania albidiflava TaxID=366586 RepID=UPI0003B52FB4|nr:HNH endonuclease signature motif containing protein [Ruania albidiflava]